MGGLAPLPRPFPRCVEGLVTNNAIRGTYVSPCFSSSLSTLYNAALEPAFTVSNNTTINKLKAMATIPVDVKEMVLVTPSEPTPSHVLCLSALDSQPLLRFTIEYLLIFHCSNKPGSNKSSLTTSHIKEALSHLLVPYYPLAGRLKSHDGGRNLEVVCGGQGALFIEAVSHVSATEFDYAPANTNQWNSLLTVQAGAVLCEDPILVIQLTWLADGNVATAMGIPHCLADGIGGAELFNSFAELVSVTKKHTDIRPIWERHLLNPTPSPGKYRSSIVHHEFEKVPDLCGFISRFSSEPMNTTLVMLDSKSLAELKRIASSIVGSPSYTSFDVLSAHVWRSWVRSLGLVPSQMVKMFFMVNIRNRVKPNLPKGYYGNAFVLTCAQTSVKELTENGLWYAAGLVNKAKERVDDTYVRSVIEAVSGEARACPDAAGTLFISQWYRLGFEKVDFGWGKPLHGGRICNDKFPLSNQFGLLLPVPEQAMKVMLNVPETAAEKYQYLLRNPCN